MKSLGFSLIEILIVLMIVTVLAVGVSLSLKSFWQNAQSNTLRTGILQAMQLARFSAISHNEKIILCKSNNQATCDGDWQDGFIVQRKNSFVLHAYHFENINGKIFSRFFPKGRETLEFLPNGWPEVQNGTFWYCNKHEKYPRWAIMINRSGRAREVFPDADGRIIDGRHQVLGC